MWLWRLASSKIHKVGQQTGDPGELVLQFQSAGCLLENSSLLRGISLFVLFRASPDWMRPTHIMEVNLLSSKFTNLNVNVIQTLCHRNTQNNV